VGKTNKEGDLLALEKVFTAAKNTPENFLTENVFFW
jgi:hypothetical protein